MLPNLVASLQSGACTGEEPLLLRVADRPHTRQTAIHPSILPSGNKPVSQSVGRLPTHCALHPRPSLRRAARAVAADAHALVCHGRLRQSAAHVGGTRLTEREASETIFAGEARRGGAAQGANDKQQQQGDAFIHCRRNPKSQLQNSRRRRSAVLDGAAMKLIRHCRPWFLHNPR